MIKDNGFSLIEILFSFSVGILLLSLLFNHYLVIKKQYHINIGELDQGFDLSLVEGLLRKGIRQAGFTPCLPLNLLTSYDRDSNNRLFSIETDERDERNTNSIEREASKSGMLGLNRMSAHFMNILESKESSLLLERKFAKGFFKIGDDMLISDCYHAERVQISAIQSQAHLLLIRLKRPLHFQYVKPIFIGEWLSEKFFIKKNKIGKTTLYFYQKNHREALASNITSLASYSKMYHGQTLLQVVLGLQNNQFITIETTVGAG